MEKEINEELLKPYEKLAALFGTTPEELYEKANKRSASTNKLSDDTFKLLSGLSQKERDILILRCGLKDGKKRTLEEVASLFGVDSDRIKQVETNAIKKLKQQAENRVTGQHGDTLKAGDIIDVSLMISPQIPEEDDEKLEIDLNDYPTECCVSYTLPNSGFADVSFREDAGASSFSDIKDYLADNLARDIEEINEYELFDVDNVGEYQTAKIKVVSLK